MPAGTPPRRGLLLAGNAGSWRTQGRALWAIAALLLTPLAGCGGSGDSLRAVEALPLPDSAVAALLPAGDGFWLASPSQIYRWSRDSTRAFPVPTALERTPEALGLAGGVGEPFFATPRALLRVRGDSLILFAAVDQATSAALDPRGRFVFRTTDMGTMVIHAAETLEPMLGWGAVGAPAEAIAISPEGDRVYQPAAATPYRQEPEILIRELQTGRILRRLETASTVRRLETDAAGSLYGVMWEDDGDGDVFAARWEDGELVIAWRTSLGSLDLEPPIRLVVTRDGRRVALLGLGT